MKNIALMSMPVFIFAANDVMRNLVPDVLEIIQEYK